MNAGFCLHPEESAGSVLAELELGDLVAVRGIGVSFRAVFPPDDRFFEERIPRAVLALERLVRLASAPLLHAVVARGLEAVHVLLDCVSVSARELLWSDLMGVGGRVPAGGVWAAWCRCCVRRCCCLRRE